MESRILVLFLMLAALPAAAQTEPEDEAEQTEQVIEPELERREIKEPDIDKENFEFGAFVGNLSIEDFGSDVVYGVRFAFHITEDFFVEAAVGRSEAGRTSFEVLSAAADLLQEDEREFTYYNVSLGYNVLPGEAFVGRGRALNNALYLIAGVGSTEFAADDRFTVNVGAGYRLLVNDWLAVHADVRDHLFDIDLLGEEKTAHNVEYHVGFTIFF